MTYLGIMLMPWLFGILARATSTALLPYYLLILLAGYACTVLALMRTSQGHKTA